jgi:hypothetical protein
VETSSSMSSYYSLMPAQLRRKGGAFVDIGRGDLPCRATPDLQVMPKVGLGTRCEEEFTYGTLISFLGIHL